MRRQIAPFVLASLAFASLSTAACATEPTDTLDVTVPAVIEFGSSAQQMNTALEPMCANITMRSLDPAELPIAEHSHVQIDCDGFAHAGADRQAEFVFADDRLAFVWILTEAEEEPALLAHMVAEYGEPSHSTDMFIAFADQHTALRRDRPEFLYYSETVAPMYRGWFDQMAGG
jgi:hypothetical protein